MRQNDEKEGRKGQIIPAKLEDYSHKLALDETKAPEVGEILAEYAREHEKEMNDIILKHRTYSPKYCISVHTQKDPIKINVIRRRYFVRKTCPLPEWNSEVYSYDNRSCELRLEWTLPSEQDSINIIKNKDIYDKDLVKWIQDFRSRTLKAPF